MTDEQLLRQFENQSLPPLSWDHFAHLKVGYFYLRKFAFDEALVLMRAGVRALNAAHGVVDSPTRGYHETMTQAWLRLIDLTLRQCGCADSADAFFAAYPQLTRKTWIFTFYSRDRILSVEARTKFVAPDLAPLAQLEPVTGSVRLSTNSQDAAA